MSSYQEAKRLIEDTQDSRQLYDLLRSNNFGDFTFGKYISRRLTNSFDIEWVIQRTKSFTDLGGMKSYFDKKVVDFDRIDKDGEYILQPLADLEKMVAEFSIMLIRVASFNARALAKNSTNPFRCEFSYLKAQALALIEMLEEVEERSKRFMMRD